MPNHVNIPNSGYPLSFPHPSMIEHMYGRRRPLLCVASFCRGRKGKRVRSTFSDSTQRRSDTDNIFLSIFLPTGLRNFIALNTVLSLPKTQFECQLVELMRWVMTNPVEDSKFVIHFVFLLILISFSIGAQVESEHVVSRLWIGSATAVDSGNYTCSIPGHGAAEFPRARVKVHVVDGEEEGEVEGEAGSGSMYRSWQFLLQLQCLQ